MKADLYTLRACKARYEEARISAFAKPTSRLAKRWVVAFIDALLDEWYGGSDA